jgi:hypothetical protein
MKHAPLIMQRFALLPRPLLPRAQSAKVLRRFRNGVPEQTEYDSSSFSSFNVLPLFCLRCFFRCRREWNDGGTHDDASTLLCTYDIEKDLVGHLGGVSAAMDERSTRETARD